MQERSEPLPKLLLDSIQYMIILQLSVKRSDEMSGIKESLLPRRGLSEQLPGLPVTVVDICHDLGILLLILAPSVNDVSNAPNFHPIGSMEIVSI
jgi:hypothetical protein